MCVFGMETTGFQGLDTCFAESGACPACMASGRSVHDRCRVTKAIARAHAKGLIFTALRDGDWLIWLTKAGAELAEDVRSRRKRGEE